MYNPHILTFLPLLSLTPLVLARALKEPLPLRSISGESPSHPVPPAPQASEPGPDGTLVTVFFWADSDAPSTDHDQARCSGSADNNVTITENEDGDGVRICHPIRVNAKGMVFAPPVVGFTGE